MLTWDDLDLSVNDDAPQERRASRAQRPTKRPRIVKKQEHRITEETPIPQTKSTKSTLPDDKIVGGYKSMMSIMPLMDEEESGADGEKKDTIVLPNLMQPSVEKEKVVDPKDWTYPLYKDKFVILTAIGVTLGGLIAKKYNKNVVLGVTLGALAGIVLANVEAAMNKKKVVEEQIEK